MLITRVFDISFGVTYSGLATVGYAIYGSTVGTLVMPATLATPVYATTGVVEQPGQGVYQVSVTIDAKFTGTIFWSTGGTIPVYGSEKIEPPADFLNVVDFTGYPSLSHGAAIQQIQQSYGGALFGEVLDTAPNAGHFRVIGINGVTFSAILNAYVRDPPMNLKFLSGALQGIFCQVGGYVPQTDGSGTSIIYPAQVPLPTAPASTDKIWIY